ncbi:MAG: cache domain-containing protein [Lachnospiraceae bacterium]|nr:cache domain-containing protein [Lachnospiraceae bacterium]MDD3661237.1 cache domain-containing protein [Lachnospiraceae bacterium]
MSLTKRISLCFFILYLFVASATIVISYFNCRNEVYSNILSEYEEYFRITENNFHVFFEDIESDLLSMSQIPVVRTADENNVTSFLNADESSFQYHYSDEELRIISLFNTYRLSHPHVNSVYMGRENGSFVRSHPRSSPTRYDPRERPWYQLALDHPDGIQMTEPYPSITNPDINIATVLALKDHSGQVFGVIGMDVTIQDLAAEMNKVELSYDGSMEFLNSSGIVLFSPLEENLYTTKQLDYDLPELYKNEKYSILNHEDHYEIISSTEILNGHFVASIPARTVKEAIWLTVESRVIFITFLILIVAGFTFLFMEWIILRPLRDMQSSLTQSRYDAVPMTMNIKSYGEIRDFQNEYNRLVQAVNHEKTELEKVKALTVTSLVSLAEIRDHETGLHIIRTQKYVELLSSAYNNLFQDKKINEYKMSIMVQCAPLHDIGKVAIPDHILLKPGKLTHEEFDIMKMHTVYGKETIVRGNVGLTDSMFIDTVVNIVYHHHERWNGSGYPLGLRTSSIPIEARIMAVADVYDAVTTNRIYKSAVSHEEAVSILKQGAGIEFDPDMIQAFLKVEQTFKAISEFYSEN